MTEAGASPGRNDVAAVVREHLFAIGVRAKSPAPSGDLRDALVRAESTVSHLGVVLARLHTSPLPRDVAAGLGVVGPEDLVESAERNVASGAITAATVSAAYRHLTLDRLVEVLRSGAAAAGSGDRVLVHGAPTLERLTGQGEFVALTDWSGAALADPHMDLAIAARDVIQRLGAAMVPVLAESYGHDRIDPRRLDWYSLAAELALGGSEST